MKRLISVFVIVMSVVVTARAQDNSTQQRAKWDWTKYRDVITPPKTLTPDQGDWLVSAGAAIGMAGTTELPEFGLKMNSGTSYGGFIASEWFLHRAFSFRASLEIFSDSEHVVADVDGTGTASSISVSETRFALVATSRLYPLQLKAKNLFPVQPFITGGFGAAFWDVNVDVNGTSVNVYVEPTLMAGGGGGLTYSFSKNWSLDAQVGYWTTIIDSRIRVNSYSTPFRQSGLLIDAGLRYRF